uniref:Microtubule-associated protein futsch n=1 Tax=Elaeophora elaphi TaxID=1147741 RepID=A0A0R3RGI2_9BILA
MIQDADLVQLLPAGHSVGSIRTRRPLMYIFSGGNEDAAFFSVNGFSILLDGGDQKVVPYWNLIRNYDKISAAVVTRISPKCLQGISAILMRKCLQECHPNFGAVICNLPPSNISNGDSEASKVLRAMHEGLRAEGLKPIEAFASTKLETVTLYEVIGEGALRMIVLNPERGSKDLTSLIHALKTDESIEKFAALTSLALLLIWHPSDHTLPVSRILITGSCSLEKLYASLEKLKNEEYLHYPEFTQASKEKPSTARPGKIIRKPTPTKNLSNLSASRPASLQVTTPSTPSEPLKKVVRQSLAGVAPPRAVGSAKRPVTEPAKASATSSYKSHTPEAKVGSKSVKSRLSDVKKNTTLEVKPKGNNIAKTKAADKAGIKAPLGKRMLLFEVKAQSSDPTSTDMQPVEVLKNSVAPIDMLSLSNPQNAASPSHLEHSFEVRSETLTSPESPKMSESSVDGPKMPESSVDPQVLDDNGLLDGIEEPMQVRKISMDFSGENKNFGDFMEEGVGMVGKEFDLLNSVLPSQDTPLLDSTPMTPSAPSIATPDENCDSSDASASKDRIAQRDEESVNNTAAHNQEVMQKENLQDLFSSGITPFMAGLVTGIVDDPSTLQDLSPANNDEFETSKFSATPVSLNELNNGTMERVQNDKREETERTTILHEIKPQISSSIKLETFSARGSGSSDSVNAQPDPALDEVIDSLAEASELVDNARKTTSELEHHVQGQVISNAQSAAAVTMAGCTEQLTALKDVFDGQVTNITHDINDNANALANQNAYEEKRAEELYLPPMTSTARIRAKPVVNGVKTKPKLSQPLYFDIVFVPHHGAHPTLKDEEAAKAFVTSVRSRRYVLSGKDSIRTYFIDGLISGKAAWNKPELEVDVLPTHDSDELTLYSHEKADEIAEAGISLRCSVERCTLRLSSGGTDDVCAAFKFEI